MTKTLNIIISLFKVETMKWSQKIAKRGFQREEDAQKVDFLPTSFLRIVIYNK